MVHYGASEIYLDGKLVQRFGAVGATPDTEVVYNPNTLPVNIVLDARGEHVLAVRHSCMEMRDMSGGWGKWIARQSTRPVVSAYADRTNNYGAGFGIWVVDAGQARDELCQQQGRRWVISSEFRPAARPRFITPAAVLVLPAPARQSFLWLVCLRFRRQ